MVNSTNIQNTFQQIPRFGANSGASRTSPNLAARRDTAGVSSRASRRAALMERFNSVTSINGQQVQQLRAVNNKLTISWNIPYRFTIVGGMLSYLLFHSNGTDWRQLFSEVQREIGATSDFFDNDVFWQNENAFAILSKLAGGAGESINLMFSREEITATLRAVGFEPGWVEMDNGHETNRFYFAACGTIQSEKLSNQVRGVVNRMDFREQGFQEGDKVMVNFEYYTVGADGRINVPEGIPVIWGTTWWIPGTEEFFGWSQDENGEWHQEKDFWELIFVSILSDEYWHRVVANRAFNGPDAEERYRNHANNMAIATANAYANNLAISALSNSYNRVSAECQDREITINRLDNVDRARRLQARLIREMRINSSERDEDSTKSELEDELRNLAIAWETIYLNAGKDYTLADLEKSLKIKAFSIFRFSSTEIWTTDYMRAMENIKLRAETFATVFFDKFGEHSTGAFEFAWAAVELLNIE